MRCRCVSAYCYMRCVSACCGILRLNADKSWRHVPDEMCVCVLILILILLYLSRLNADKSWRRVPDEMCVRILLYEMRVRMLRYLAVECGQVVAARA